MSQRSAEAAAAESLVHVSHHEHVSVQVHHCKCEGLGSEDVGFLKAKHIGISAMKSRRMWLCPDAALERRKGAMNSSGL